MGCLFLVGMGLVWLFDKLGVICGSWGGELRGRIDCGDVVGNGRKMGSSARGCFELGVCFFY